MAPKRTSDLTEARRHLNALELAPGATLDDVKQAYRDLARVWHPDRFTDERLSARAAERLKKINAAYDWIKVHPAALERIAREPLTATHTTASRPRPPEAKPAPQQPPPEPKREEPKREDPPPTAAPSAAPMTAPVSLTLPYLAVAATTLIGLGYFLARYSATSTVTVPLRAPHAEVQKPPPAEEEIYDPDEAEERARAFVQWVDAVYPTNTPTLVATVRRPTPMPIVDKAPDHFTLGSPRDLVVAVQGVPSQTNDEAWWYGASKVVFKDNRVVRWYAAPGNPLRVRLDPAPGTPALRYIYPEATRDEVLSVQGTPTGYTDHVWQYGDSRVFFEGDRVSGWSSGDNRPLSVRIEPAGEVGAIDHFERGSSRDEVLALQGTPTEFSHNEWSYGRSRVYFEGARVIGWKNTRSDPLNAVGDGSLESHGDE